MNIHRLTDDVINQIAAGEVVDRPASVVRELVDNAVDAGAAEVFVSLIGGGQESLRVRDDGQGIAAAELCLAFERHTTSKLARAQDLVSILTLGFRGEALSSIASVSKVTLRSRTRADTTATQVRLAAGQILGIENLAGPFGTEVEVSALFFNTPARRKFLKSPRVEEARTKQWLAATSLARPAIRFRLLSDEREVLNLPPRGDAIERARGLFVGNCVAFDRSYGPCRVQGMLAHPGQARSDALGLVTLVNGRVVSDRLLLRSIKDGFGAVLKEREVPVGFVSIDLPAGEVDVNVHPQKSEIRFRAPQAVFVSVRNAVQTAVTEFRGAIEIGMKSPSSMPSSLDESACHGKSPPGPVIQGAAGMSGRSSQQTLFASSGECRIEGNNDFRFSSLRFLGQAFSCYLLCEGEGKLYVVDMHAAHERINYNSIRQSLRRDGVASQELLLPLRIELTEEQSARLESYSRMLELAGFGFKFDAHGIELMRVPAILAGLNVEPLVREIAAAGHEEEGRGLIELTLDELAQRISCHASVRSGKQLTREEVYALLSKLDESEFGAACPHGRPVVVSFAEDEVERWFGRDR